MKFLSVLVISFFLIITACGGGGGSSSDGTIASSTGGGGDQGSGGGGTAVAEGAVIKLAWDPNTESDVAGYKVYYGTSSGNYEKAVDIGKTTEYLISGLTKGQTYYISVTAYDTASNESGFSNEVTGSAA